MLYPSKHSLAFFLTTLSISTIFSNQAETLFSTDCENNQRRHRISVRHIEKGGIGYYQGYSTLEGFFSANPEKLSIMPFLDLRAHVFNDGKLASNAGFGCRKIVKKRTYGFNAYYDYRNTSRLHYNQIGLGLETLGTFWDLRLNGYLPVGKKITSPYQVGFSNFSGHNALLIQKRQFGMKGVNADLGFHFGKSKNFDFYTSAGPYYFIGEAGSNIWGGKVRLLGKYKDYIQLELSDSYDRMFHNKFQGQLTFSIPLGPKTGIKKSNHINRCSIGNTMISRMLQPVIREEIVVVGKADQKTEAINPVTGKPYHFVFVDNTSHSYGTYESPYHTLTQAELNSSKNNIIYVYPGDGSTQGMDSGINLKDGQKLWGSGINHNILTSEGTITIPAQSSVAPKISNTNIDTLGNAITLSYNNCIEGINITEAIADGVYGTDVTSLNINNSLFEDVNTFTIEATSSSNSKITIKNNQFLNNQNGIYLNLNGPSKIICENNIFEGQLSESEPPLIIIAEETDLDLKINDNTFNNNQTGSVRCNLLDTNNTEINFNNNIVTNNDTGSASTIGSAFVITPNGTVNNCTVSIQNNIFSNNSSCAVIFDDFSLDGQFNSLNITAASNTLSNNGGSGFVLAMPIAHLNFIANNNTITNSNDNGISIAETAISNVGSVSLNNNTINNLSNAANGINIAGNFSKLNLTILDNNISDCEGSGVIIYSGPSISDDISINIANNTINNCENISSNLASGLSINNCINLNGLITNNTLINNAYPSVYIGYIDTPSVTQDFCILLSGNTSNEYLLDNQSGGTFNVSPINAEAINIGTFSFLGIVTPVKSCPVTDCN